MDVALVEEALLEYAQGVFLGDEDDLADAGALFQVAHDFGYPGGAGVVADVGDQIALAAKGRDHLVERVVDGQEGGQGDQHDGRGDDGAEVMVRLRQSPSMAAPRM